jgi:hypothetical protein
MNRLELESLVASAYPDNNSGLVTPAILRSTTDDIINNSVLPEDLVAGTNVTIDKSSLPSVTINATGGGTTPTLAVVLASGNDAGGQSMIGIGSITASGNLTALSLTTSALSHLDGGAIIENLSVTTTSLGPALEVTGSYTSLDGGAITSSGNGDLTILGQHPTPMPANAGINTFYAGMNLYGDDSVSVILDADCFYGNPLRVNAGGTDVFSVDNSGNVIAGSVHINDGVVTASQLNVDALDVVYASSLDNGNITTNGSGVLTATGLVATPTNTASLSPVEGQICVDNSVPGNSRLVIWLNGIWNTVSITAG